MSFNDNIDYIIKGAKKILITTHINPDGDALGSLVGLYSLIKSNYKKDCDLAIENLPKVYEFLPFIKDAKFFSDIDKSLVYDLVITVDVASLDRLGEIQVLFEKAKKTINIDHHETNVSFADENLVVGDASSAGEVIYTLAKDCSWSLNIESALAIYTAILTDTGAFKFSNTTDKTFSVVAELLKFGVKPHDVYKQCFESYPKNFFMFQNFCLNKAVFLKNDKVAYTEVFMKDVEKFSVGADCTEGLTEKLRAISSVEIAFIAKEIATNVVKFSMRSKSVNVASICSEFGGGGHKLAAGCVIKASMKSAVEKVLSKIENIKL